MTAASPFPDLPDGLARAARMPGWPRLMGDRLAADYLGIGVTTLVAHGPQSKKIRGRTLWDIRDLDRFADGLGGPGQDAAPGALDESDDAAHAGDLEARFVKAQRNRGKANG